MITWLLAVGPSSGAERDGEGERADLTGAPGLLVFSGQRLVSHWCSLCSRTRRAWVFGSNTMARTDRTKDLVLWSKLPLWTNKTIHDFSSREILL